MVRITTVDKASAINARASVVDKTISLFVNASDNSRSATQICIADSSIGLNGGVQTVCFSSTNFTIVLNRLYFSCAYKSSKVCLEESIQLSNIFNIARPIECIVAERPPEKSADIL